MNNKKRTGNYKPWNKGLTKETDPRVKRIGQKISKLNKGCIAWNKGFTKNTNASVNKISKSNKGHIPWNKGLTKDTDERVAKMRFNFLGRHHTEKTRKQMSLLRSGQTHSWSNKGYHHTEQQKKKWSLTRKGSPGYWTGKSMPKQAKKKMSISHKRQWKNPEWVKKWRVSIKIKPTRPEKHLSKLLKEWFPSEYKYVGDFSFMIEGKNPDFMNINGQKKLIELFGDYWHRNDDPEKRIRFFGQYGFNTLVIWQHELKNEKKLRTKVTSFHRRKQ